MQTFNEIASPQKQTDLINQLQDKLVKYRLELKSELGQILAYWENYTPDKSNGGFVGKIDHSNKVFHDAPKGSVLNSRILWSFSAAYNLEGNSAYLRMAERAFDYLQTYFLDNEHGGVYWTVDYKGKPLSTKKQTYALAFAVYGLSEYYKASGNESAKNVAISVFNDIVKYSFEPGNGGYIEALSRDWKESDDPRLSTKDANERKSMNTHLHVLEAFTNLYRIWPDNSLKEKIKDILHIFLDHIISKQSNHLELFFDDQWKTKSSLISYGHDIEASWLLPEAAQIIGDKILQKQVNSRSMMLLNAAAKGLDEDGGLWYEYDTQMRSLVKEKHSWPQAEAMIGFFNAWQSTGRSQHLDQSIRSWQFVQKHIQDKERGEWKWGVYEDYSIMDKEDKVGIWKCPYHNSRACIEIINRISTMCS